MRGSAWLQRFHALVLLTLVAGAAFAVDKDEHKTASSTDAAKDRRANRVRELYDPVPPLNTPEDVESEVGVLVFKNRQLTRRCLEILDPANRNSYDYKQRAGAAVMLGELRVSQAVPLLFIQLVDDAEHAPLFITDLNPLIKPAYNALAKIGGNLVPESIDLLRSHGSPVVQGDVIMLMRHSLGSKHAVVGALEQAIARETDDATANRLRATKGWAAENMQD